MYMYRCIILTTIWGPFCYAFCSFVATGLIFKDLIESRHRVTTPWVELDIARAPSFILLKYCNKHTGYFLSNNFCALIFLQFRDNALGHKQV